MNNKSQFRADHQRIIWLNGGFSDASEAVIPAESKGLFYGAGCFETMRASQGRLLHLDRHIQRLEEGIEYIGGDSLHNGLRGELRDIISELLTKNDLHATEAIVRIQVSLRGRRGYSGTKKQHMNLMISSDELDQKQTSVSLKSVDTRVVPSECRPSHLKLSNTLHYMDAWQSSKRAGADDALMLTVDGNVAETAVANVFWKSGNTVYTPSVDCNILPGIMRGIVIDLLTQFQAVEFHQGHYSPENLQSAEEAWITNSVREIVPVRQIDGIIFHSDTPFYFEITKALKEYKNRYLV